MPGITRRDFLNHNPLTAGSALLVRVAVAEKASGTKPNIILCMTDDLSRGDTTGYNRHPMFRGNFRPASEFPLL